MLCIYLHCIDVRVEYVEICSCFVVDDVDDDDDDDDADDADDDCSHGLS